ncbi:MAG TPA: nucleotidyltransferase family protein [Bacillota bacterium]|nr:nucleotidyltransferase family protein [Bacillota bacterium]
MKALVLCAGYGKRMYPITLSTPKPLLPVNGRPLLLNLLDNIAGAGIREISIISNQTHYREYARLLENYRSDIRLDIISNGVESPDDALGAIGDMAFAINRIGKDDDMLIIAGDSHLSFSLSGFIESFRKTGLCSVIVQKVDDLEYLKRLGVAELDSTSRIIGFEEKPQQPKSDMAAYAAYAFNKEALSHIDSYLEHGNHKDALGKIIGWLLQKTTVMGYVAEGKFIDIGTPETYKSL